MLKCVIPSRTERNLGYPPANTFAGMRSFVTLWCQPRLGRNGAVTLFEQDPDDTKIEMPRCPDVLTVYLPILILANNALFLLFSTIFMHHLY
jgi:hypothetical protein